MVDAFAFQRVRCGVIEAQVIDELHSEEAIQGQS
jgi:hypothetical protein